MPRIGIDLGGSKIEGIVLDPAGRELARRRVPTPRGDYEATVAALVALVEALEDEASCRGRARIGIGTPGALSRVDGTIKNANSVVLNGQPLCQDLERRLGRELRLANDANCFALSEAIDGAGRGASVVFGVILGTGVGGGVVVDGKVLVGANAVAGEWGHNPLPWPEDDERPGPSCYCGRSGCIETFLSGPGMTRDHEAHSARALDAPAIAAGAGAREAACSATLERYAGRLARALAHVINLLDPDLIVLGGGLSGMEALYRLVPERWGRFVFSDRVDTRLLPPVHGDSSGVRGAASLWDPA